MIYEEAVGRIEVLGSYDVIVCGGGPSGCAAAISAARLGAKTLLLEKDGYAGGALVSQLVCVILSTNAVDFQGIWHEFAARMKTCGGAYLEKSSLHYHGCFSPELAKYAWDELLSTAGVETLFHVYSCRAILEEDKAIGVIAETRAGRRAILGKRIIDCTGDGIVAAQAGVGFELGDGENPYAMALTKVCRIGNAPVEKVNWTDASIKEIRGKLKKEIAAGRYHEEVIKEMNRLIGYIDLDAWRLPAPRRERMSVVSRILKVNPLDPFQVSEAERQGRRQAMETADFYRRHVLGFENSYLLDTSNQVGIRSSRRLHGIDTVNDDDAWNFRKRPDAIARSSWEIDIWPADSYSRPAVSHADKAYIERGRILREQCEYFDIPYGSIVCKDIDNFLMGGRCISASHQAESSLRIQQTCMSTGQAAGVAAALSIEYHNVPRMLDSQVVIRQLEQERDVAPAFDIL